MFKRNKNSKDESEPVVYCAKCYSLKIKYEETTGSDYCMDCGCTDTKESTTEEWEKLYAERYGHKFVEESKNPKNSIFFKFSSQQLKSVLFNHPQWKRIIKNLYPTFPEGYSKSDSIILLFDKLAKDNRINNLRTILSQKFK